MQPSTMAEKDRRHLPLEIIFNIFRRLPGSSLMKFLTLSKSICSMIRSRDFIESQLNHASSSTKPPLILLMNSGSILLVETKTWTVTNSLSLYPLHDQYKFGGSCNGLVCFYDGFSGHVLVINPTTREYLTALRPLHLQPSYGSFSCTIVFVSSSNEYKLVYLCTRGRGSLPVLQVCSFRDKLCRQVAVSNCPIVDFNLQSVPRGILSRDALFWLGFGSNNTVWLLCFDLKTESITHININIEPFERQSNDFMLRELGHDVCLSILPKLRPFEERKIHLWIFDGERDFSQKMHLLVPKDSKMRPLFMNGEKIFLHNWCFNPGLYSYDLTNGSCNKVFMADYCFCCSAYPHIDSLVSLGAEAL